MVLPRALDRVGEAWAGAPPRARTAMTVLAIIAVTAVAGRGATRSRWGPEVTVVVATTDLSPGQHVDPGDVTDRAWPADLVPLGALRAPSEAVGARVVGPIGAGVPLRGADLRSRGPTASLRPGHVAIAVPREGMPVVHTGDWVDLVGVDPVRGATVVAADAHVLAVDPDVLWFEVRREHAAVVAVAADGGALTVALLPSP